MGRTDKASRVIEAPLKSVYAALIDPEALAEWLPPEGMTGHFEHFEPRAGGSYRMTLTYVDPSSSGGKSSADSDVVEGHFVELILDDRVVQAAEFHSSDPSFAGTMIITWSVTEADTGTRVDVIADDVPPGISADDHVSGMNSSLSNLAGYLGRQGSPHSSQVPRVSGAVGLSVGRSRTSRLGPSPRHTG